MKLKGLLVTGVIVALGIATRPSLAQDSKMYWSNMTDWSTPYSVDQSRVTALEWLGKGNFSKADIMKAIPLLEDLATAEDAYNAATYTSVNGLVWNTDEDKISTMGEYSVQNAQQAYRDKHDKIWGTLRQSIGDDKATTLMRLVEPVKEDTSKWNFKSARITRIETMLVDLDKMESDRIAALPEDQRSTVKTVSVETTIIPVTPDPTITVYTSPTLRAEELSDLLKMKLAAMEGTPEAIMMLHNHDLNSTNLRFLREHKIHQWN